MHDLVLKIQQRLVNLVDTEDSEESKKALLELKELSERIIELEDDLAVAQMVAQNAS